MNAPKRVVVTGATGLIGKALVAALVARGDAAVVLSRRPDEARTLVPGAAAYLPWRPDDLAALADALDGADAVVNLGAVSLFARRWSSAFKREIRESRVQGTRSIVAAMGRASRPPGVLVNAAAVGIYGPRGSELVDEGSALGDDFLAGVCISWEAEARQAEQHGARVALLRSGVVLDAHEGALKMLMLPFRMGVGGPVLPGSQWMSWVHRDDEVGLILHALDTASVSGPLNAVAPFPQMNFELAKTLGETLGRPSWLPVPGFAVRLAVGEVADTVTTGQYVVPRKAIGSGYAFRFPSAAAALADLLG